MAYDDKGNYVSAKDRGRGDWQKIAYENLANAIIERACDDYIELGDSDSVIVINNVVHKKELMSFFHSQWFSELTEVDPYFLLRKLDENAQYLSRKKIKDKEEEY